LSPQQLGEDMAQGLIYEHHTTTSHHFKNTIISEEKFLILYFLKKIPDILCTLYMYKNNFLKRKKERKKEGKTDP
jgi:hypothetical protein